MLGRIGSPLNPAELPIEPAPLLTICKGSLPIGAQIVGPWLEDRMPLKLAELIERELGGFKPPKAFVD